eukprot:CAMPEP_0167814106 /NCGR_PEP_ID=MMETSP0112_2-20121227/2231_1 /TAXON_ID=91324 /ORGANISM="Lotharella globosa, Strain CCCM811" /LENGTH=85 /DNA_ID=CAMNT_0007713275 /DNA_START=453 /DNA_END=711 /DNA_ORIENTATION=+
MTGATGIASAWAEKGALAPGDPGLRAQPKHSEKHDGTPACRALHPSVAQMERTPVHPDRCAAELHERLLQNHCLSGPKAASWWTC